MIAKQVIFLTGNQMRFERGVIIVEYNKTERQNGSRQVKKNRRDKTIKIRVSTDEYQKMKKLADKKNLNMSQFLRNKVLNKKEKQSKVMNGHSKEDIQNLIKALNDLNMNLEPIKRDVEGASTNINQIAKKVNIDETEFANEQVQKILQNGAVVLIQRLNAIKGGVDTIWQRLE
ncbi:TPA: plasmid mobilization relaxosome protein MobC [Staphylococcus aureus]|nr:plasmid mobilization relaxosome protein MobC [Staphylococcus aureus]